MRPARAIVCAAAGLAVIVAAVGWRMARSRAVGPRADEGVRLQTLPPTIAAPLPRPPRQDEAWTPAEPGVPASLVEAARVLFEQGFADPRGCEYREVELAGEAEAYARLKVSPPATHAWVIPSAAGDGPRSAVAWNGLVYPVTRLGPAADLEADVRALTVPSGTPGDAKEPPVRAGAGAVHLLTATQHGLTAAKAVVLLRLGGADLAEALWRTGIMRELEAMGIDPTDGRACYAELASAWAQDLLERAGTAHASGDDRLALASLRELARIRPLLLARAGDVKPIGVVDSWNRTGIAPYVDFLGPLPEFLADQERRAREPGRTSASASRISDRAARIAALIGDFDQVRAAPVVPLPWVGVDLASDAIVRAVIREGDAAIEPLLECLERDERLTRTVEQEYRRPTRSVRVGKDRLKISQALDGDLCHLRRFVSVHRVEEAAFAALCSILGTRAFGPASQDYAGRADRPRRAAVAAEIRDYWRKNRGLEPVARLYRTLADDAATPEQWLVAARDLAEPNDVRRRGNTVSIPARPGGKVPPLRGEPLRGRIDPGVTELMARRAREADRPDGPPGSIGDVSAANTMAGYLAAWDLAGALPTLRDRVARTAAFLSARPRDSHSFEMVGSEIARFTMLRVKGGDPSAMDDYASWARIAPKTPGQDFFRPEIFEPLWTYPDHPAIAAVSAALFDDPGSPWVPLFRPLEPGWDWSGFRSDMITSPLLGVAPFRKLVLAGLADDRASGSIRCDADGKGTIQLDRRLSMFHTFGPEDPARPRPGTTTNLRMRDNYAWKLQQVEGFPRFELYWSQERRDRTIAAVVERLARYGERFRTTEVSLAHYRRQPFYPRHVRAMLVFSPLDRLANAEDVAAGRAIFAAGPGAEARRWPLPDFPMEARWTMLDIEPDDPGLSGQPLHVGGRPTATAQGLRGGRVWQAEEVREGDRWHRYYGFLGRHVIARVPAEEIDFRVPWDTGWSEISRDLDGRLIPPGVREDGNRMIAETVAPVGGPLPFIATLRNHRGIATVAPADLGRPGEGGPSLRAGVSIRVFRAPNRSPRTGPAGRQSGGIQDPPPWPEVAPRREPARYRSDAATTLDPTGTLQVLGLDLRDLFDLDRPGRYRVEVRTDDIRTEEGTPALISAQFQLKSDGAGTAR